MKFCSRKWTSQFFVIIVQISRALVFSHLTTVINLIKLGCRIILFYRFSSNLFSIVFIPNRIKEIITIKFYFQDYSCVSLVAIFDLKFSKYSLAVKERELFSISNYNRYWLCSHFISKICYLFIYLKKCKLNNFSSYI